MLANYVNEVQNLLNDNQGQFFQFPTLANYINRSRRRIAAISGCLRVIPPGVQTIPNQEVYTFRSWDPLVQLVMPQAQSVLACRSLALGIGGRWQVTEDENGNILSGSIVGGSWKPLWRRLLWTAFH